MTGNYYTDVYKADSLFLEKDYVSAFNLLEDLFNRFDPIQIKEYYEYTTYTKLTFLLGKNDKFISCVKSLVVNFGYEKDQIEKDDILKNIFELEPNFEFDKLHSTFLSNSDDELRLNIESAKILDQQYRSSMEDYEINRVKQDSIDIENSKFLITLFDSKGYPSQHKMGLSSTRISIKYDITAILLHANDSLKIEAIIPRLHRLIEKGMSDPELYARVYDRYLIENKKDQVYFTYKSDQQIKDEQLLIINEKRSEIGLPRLRNKVWRLSKKYGDGSPIMRVIREKNN